MIPFTSSHLGPKSRSAHHSEAKNLRARAELLLKSAAELLDTQDAARAERQEMAYQLSNEALGLLAELRSLEPTN